MTTDINLIIQQKREQAARATAELQKLELMQEMLNDSEMRKILAEQLGLATPTEASKPTGGVGLTKLRKVMTSNGNKPLLITELAELSNLSISSVRQLMTKTQAFVKVSTNDSRQGLYKLKEEWIGQSNQD